MILICEFRERELPSMRLILTCGNIPASRNWLRSEIIIDLATGSCNVTSASDICSRVSIVGQTTDLTIGTYAADALVGTCWGRSLLNNTALVVIPECLNTIGNTEVAYVAAAFECSPTHDHRFSKAIVLKLGSKKPLHTLPACLDSNGYYWSPLRRCYRTSHKG